MPEWTNSFFTFHAQERLSERFKICEEQLLDLLNIGKLGVKLGVSKETFFIHRLVWSEVDNNHIVIVQNVINGAILTVLTIDMYKCNYPKNITDRSMQKAINQIANRRRIMRKMGMLKSNKLLISGVFLIDDGRQLVKNIGRWKEDMLEEEIESLSSRKDFWTWAEEMIIKKELPLNGLLYISGGYSICEKKRIYKNIEK